MKKVLALLLAMAMVLSLVACGGGASNEGAAETEEATETAAQDSEGSEAAPSGETMKIAFVFPYALDALPWLVTLVDELTAYDESHDEVEFQITEATEANQYEPVLRSFCDAGYDVVFSAFNNFTEALTTLSAEYPDIKFGSLEGRIPNISELPNVMEFQIPRDVEFLSGYTAALMTKTGKIGLIAGNDIAAVDEILAAYEQGASYANNGTEVLVSYANSYTDATKGREVALSLMDRGVDVILGTAGGTEDGILQAIKETGDCYYIADDTTYEEMYAGIEICNCHASIVGLYLGVVDSVVAGDFQGATCLRPAPDLEYNVFHFSEGSPVPEDIQKQVMEAKDLIYSGEIKVTLVPEHK